MTNSQKLTIKLSSARQKINELLGVEERSEDQNKALETLTAEQILSRVRAMLPHRTGKMRRGVRITRTVDGIAIHIPQYYRNQLTSRLKNLRFENLVSSVELESTIARHL